MEQLILHLFGDYVTQSQWMANNKTKQSWAAAIHALTYSLPFWILNPSLIGWLTILVTHFMIDRYRLARFLVMFKNMVLDPEFWTPQGVGRKYATDHGSPADTPPWLAVWLLIIADNTVHLAINYAALRWL